MVICTSDIEGIGKMVGSHFLKTASRDRANYIAVYREELTEVAISRPLVVTCTIQKSTAPPAPDRGIG